MLGAQLSTAASVQRLGRPSASVRTSKAAGSLLCSQRRHFWRGNRQWESPLDPGFQHFHRKRHQRVRAALRDALRRRSKWATPVPLEKLFGARQASHWTKGFRRGSQPDQEHGKGQDNQNDPEILQGERRWKKHMQAVKQFADSDPYKAVFGRSFNPLWSPSMLDSILPKRISAQSEQLGQSFSTDAKSNSDVPGFSREFSSSPSGSKNKRYAESSTFTYSSRKEPGKDPVIKASSSKWDSASNATTTYHFDPVTNRMVPDQSPATATSNLEGAKGISGKTAQFSQGRPTTKQTSDSSNASSQVPQNIRDALAVRDGYSDKPSGMQTSFSAEKDGNNTSLEEEIARQATADVNQPDGYSTEPIGMQTSYSAETKACAEHDQIPLSEEISTNTVAEDAVDGYSTAPIGMQTSYSAEQQSDQLPLDQELSTNTVPIDVDDGYTKAPIGMQTSYSKEAKSDQPSLDYELSTNTIPIDVEDGYSKDPIGMQTSYSSETKSGQVPLDRELSTNTDSVEFEDGYSRQPVGMQTSYRTEQNDCDNNQRLSLDQEISTNTRSVDVEDGYSQEPIGMQTSYNEEQHAIDEHLREPLEQEINKRELPVDVEDGYSRSPIGMQTSFVEEQQACTDHKQVPLDQEISENLTVKYEPDGYTNEPMGMQTSYKHEQEDIENHTRQPLEEEILHPTEIPFDDGYSDKPMGMQTNFETEQQDIAEHRRLPLEEEINAVPVDADDGYTKKSFGLQNTFEQEQEDVTRKGRRSLEEEIELNDRLAVEANFGLAGQFRDGYTNQPRGLQTSYGQEHTDYAGGRRISLEDELRSRRVASEARNDHSLQNHRGWKSLTEQERPQYQPPAKPSEHRQGAAAREFLENRAEAAKQAARALEAQGPSGTTQPISKRPFHAASTGGDKAAFQGEGDVSNDVSKFASSDKWYKQESVKPNEALVEEIVRICADNGLLKQHNELQKVQERLLGKLRSLEHRLKSEKHSGPEVTVGDQFRWADPPSYKILAYDFANDAIQTVTTTSRFSEKERPISVPNAMSKVRDPARFVSHFASLQKDGYQAIHASNDLLVFRKVQHPSDQTDAVEAELPKAATVNPVDGTVRQPATGNFASPTGFVNHDPVFPIEQDESKASDQLLAADSEIQDGIYYRHYPRVRRQEPVFSGRRIKHHEEDDGHHHRGWRYRRERRAAWKRRVKFAVSVGATSAALVYALGVGAELAKGDKSGGA